MQKDIQRRYVTVPEFSEMLGISEKRGWKMVAHREVDVFRCGRSVRISLAVIEKLIEAGTTPARAS